MNIQNLARKLLSEQRQHQNQLHKFMLHRAEFDLDRNSFNNGQVLESKVRKLMTGQRQHEEHLKSSMLCRMNCMCIWECAELILNSYPKKTFIPGQYAQRQASVPEGVANNRREFVSHGSMKYHIFSGTVATLQNKQLNSGESLTCYTAIPKGSWTTCILSERTGTHQSLGISTHAPFATSPTERLPIVLMNRMLTVTWNWTVPKYSTSRWVVKASIHSKMFGSPTWTGTTIAKSLTFPW